MKKLLIAALVFGLFVSFCGIALAAPMSDAARAQLTNQAKEKLSSQQWTVYVVSTVGKRSVTETDVFTITKDGKITSQNLTAQGYRASNCNVGVQDDGTTVWETMQVNSNNDLAFIRAELSGNIMKGVISMQPLKGGRTTLHFSTASPDAVAAPAAAVTATKK